MLNKDALQQLAQLKSAIAVSKDIAQGLVRTTTKRFGFLLLDDGREAFIDPDQMMRVLPDDRVEAEITTNNKGQFEAKLLKLIAPGLQEFVGRYVNKGAADFVEPDVNNFNRWLFIPPQERKGYKVGDLIHCTVARHPFSNDGKVQIHILNRIGTLDEPGVESRYSIAKFQIPFEWPAAAQTQAGGINWSPLTFENDEQDLTHLPFVTIDSENTRDMDDAIYIAPNDNGWELLTAIADPSKHIEFDSPLEQTARTRASTHYLLGQTVTMLPVDLSHDTYSLVPEQKRPALVCKMQIQRDGTISSFTFLEAQIRSHHKLSYQGVYDALMETSESSLGAPAFIHNMLMELKGCAQARAQYRQNNALMMEERPDYSFVLNEQKKIDHIEKRERNIAHRMIEEAMLATNLCAGELFLQHPGYGIFSGHIGFRPERVNDALALIQEDRPDLSPGDLTQLDAFTTLFRELRSNPTNHPASSALHSLLQRMLQAGSLTFEPTPHFGLGFKAYAMATSPIRRYNDLFNHIAIKRILRGEQPIDIHDKKQFTEALQNQLNNGRQAARYTEAWLGCQYAAQHIGSLHQGSIALVNSFGLGIKLDDWGLDGYALLTSKDSEIKAQFDSRRLSLTIEGKTWRLDDKVYVLIKDVDIEKRKIGLEIVSEETAQRLSAWL
ncbi:VacB/RNase II family 3'-5' exoribonuclease [Cellvibrio sp. pealriver]|uniref:VacB/RNase II family 3'-5' exoribonuclease n=1 Tax=Cellvibrio sp. pealriver TaxID=1622269 RepID=UPI00066FF9EA|nr:VacB/RNase II family 3'-5' exoribonuclease [Cellvibrio sp. pealriver]